MSQNLVDPHVLSFWEHIEELRRVVLKSVVYILSAAILALIFYREILNLFTAPLELSPMEHHAIRQERVINRSPTTQIFSLPKGGTVLSISHSIIQRDAITYSLPPDTHLTYEYPISDTKLAIFSPLEGMMMVFKLSFWVGLTLSSPLWFYTIFSFIAPALTANTCQLVAPFIALSLVFMLAGFLFAYNLTIPLANQYLSLFNQDIGLNLWSLSNYMDYTITLLLGNGIAFEGLVVGLFLVHYRKLSTEQLLAFRRYFIVFAFIIGAILTPPDILTQLMLAIPLIIFYEIIILYASFRTPSASFQETQFY